MSFNAGATADGPDEWVVSGVNKGSVLNIRAEPSARANKIGTIEYNGRGLANLGCNGEPAFTDWEKMTDSQRERSKKKIWCRIRYQNIEGWVLGIYLREDN